jgi:hypothetical protein
MLQPAPRGVGCGLPYLGRLNRKLNALRDTIFSPLAECPGRWTLIIPMTQWALSTAVVSISWCLICGYSEPVDIVLNSMALTFIRSAFVAVSLNVRALRTCTL